MKRKRAPITIVFLFVFFICCLPSAMADDPSVGPDSVRLKAPHIFIVSNNWMPVFKAGEKATLSIPLENTGSSATDIEVSLVVTDADKFPFKTDKISFTRYLASLSGSNSVSFNLSVPTNVKPGIYPLTVNISYGSDYGGGGQTNGTIYVKIENDFKQPALKLSNVQLEGNKLLAGKTSMVKLIITNDGNLNANDTEVSLSGFTANGLNLENWSETQCVGQIKGNERRPVSYQINVDPDIKSGTYTLDLAINYKDDHNQEYKKSSKVYLPVAGKGSQNDLTPRIIIDNYNYGGGDHVLSGQVFPLTISFTNTSQETAVHNIKVSLNSDGQVFAPVGSSNTLYIPAMAPGSLLEKTIYLKPKDNAESQTYIITAEIDYQDDKGNKCSEKEIISVPVAQSIELLISEVKTPPEAFAQNPLNISADFYNTGRAVIRNLRIYTEGNFETRDGDLFLGTFDPGKNDYYDVNITPLKEGPLEGKIIFEYDDNTGTHYRTDKTFQLQVLEQQPMPPVNFQPPVKGKNKFAFKPWMWAAGVAVLGVVTYIIYRKRKKAKEMMELELDE